MEFCSGGSCADLMKPGHIGEDYIAIIMRELLLGLDYLHADKKLHRDVKGTGISAGSGEWARTDCANKDISGECTAQLQRTSKTCRFRRIWTAISHHDQEEHICGHTFLDGARGYQAIWL